MFSHSRLTISGGTFNQTVNSYNSRGIDHLKAATAPAAFHNSRERFDPPKCHPRTREAVLKKIMEWIQRKIDTHAFVMWLYGAAGAGKSAIAQTIAEICHKEGLLLASFFFSLGDSLRNTTEHLVATLAYQIIVSIPSARGLIETAVEGDPLIFSRSLDAQFETLIVRPLKQLRETGVFEQISPPSLIILDGLDECIDGTRTHLIDLISTISRTDILVFLIASRAEQDISTAIRFGSMEKVLTQIALDTEYQSREDIELFFRDRFDEIKRTHPLRVRIPPPWPTDAIIRALVAKSSGQFIYAATALRYVSSTRHRPTTRLDIILGISPPMNENDAPFAQLDALYMHIISSSEDPPWTVRIISVCLLLPTILFGEMWMLEDFLGLPFGDGGLFLSDLASIIEYTDDIEQGSFWVLHASLGDFLFDVSRSRQFYVDPQTMHTEISMWCLDKIMEGESTFRTEDLWQCAAHNCPLARPNPQLVYKIRSASLRNKFEESLKDPLTFSLYFLDCIKDMRFEESKSLHKEYLSIYDQKFVSYLDNKTFTSLDVIHIRYPRLLRLADLYNRIPTVQSALWRVFSHIFNVPFGCKDRYFIHNVPDHKIYVYDFFDDITRSGRHAIHDGHYITSAEKCAEYLLDPHHIPIQGVRAWATQSRKHAWLWRSRKRSILKSIRNHWRYRFWKKYLRPHEPGPRWSWVRPESPLEPLLLVHIVLTILPPLLANAAQGSKNLDALCNKLISGRLPFFIFPCRSAVAKRAINAYLVSREEYE